MATLLRVSIAGAVAFCIAYFLGGFSLSQSVTLAVFALILLYFLVLIAPQKRGFVAYYVFVEPNLYNIVTDTGLVADAESEWAKVREGIASLPKEPSNIWNSGFTLSVLTPELIYVKEQNRFATEEVELFASLAPVTVPFHKPVGDGPEVDSRLGPHSPRLVVEGSLHSGYSLTLTVPEWFWESIKAKDRFRSIPEHDVSIDQMCGTVDVTLVWIPPQEFEVHNALTNGRYTPERRAKALKARSEMRSRFGWKGKSQSDMYENETGEESSNVAEHRYCTVYHDAI